MAEDSLLKFIFPKADPKGIQRGLNFVFPKANFDFAGEDTEEIIDDNEIIKPPMPGKSIDLNLIPDEIQEKLNLLSNVPILKKKDKTAENVVTSDNVVDDNVDVDDGADDTEQSLTPTMEGFEEFTELQPVQKDEGSVTAKRGGTVTAKEGGTVTAKRPDPEPKPKSVPLKEVIANAVAAAKQKEEDQRREEAEKNRAAQNRYNINRTSKKCKQKSW